ncbi:arsenate reductase (glutaredoxin) [Pusillimonas minor]|uniref:Arsenate reductase n=1 Tax=Pusillimonas minor TaxID=2697024 RepID=A0A842HP10_9BURK|nr:arsenate reductase (glutaredoxin) [Pusillimonas minor]MBC2769452.1 arsenate reductase (glutaredoxin) [Pusillimonas minor]
MSNVTIYHNPKCGTSRNTLALIRHAGIEPNVVLYLETPPARETIQKMVADAGLTLREAMREKGTPYAELGLDKPEVSDEQLLDAIEAHPILLNRPFVVTEKGTRLCRPSEVALDILPPMPARPFAKEDGTPMLDAQGRLITK